MRPFALPALLAALVFVPAADACFLKCFRSSAGVGRGPEPVNTVTIVSIDGQTPTWNPTFQRYELPNPIPKNTVVKMLVRTNFNPGNATYFVLSSCTEYAAKPMAATAAPAGYTDYDKSIDIGPYDAGQSCSVRVTVTTVSSDTVYFTVSP